MGYITTVLTPEERAQGRAEERRAGDRHDRARSGRRGVGACRLGAAGPGPSHRGGADRRRRARAEAVRHPRRHRHGHRARRLVDRVGQLCEPLRARGRRRRAARGRAAEAEARARRGRRSSTCRPTRSSSRRAACARRAIPTMRCRSGALAATRALGAGDARRRRPGAARDRVLDPAAADRADRGRRHQLLALPRLHLRFLRVEVDRVTGAVRIDKYVTMHDCGRVLHPGMVAGQVTGGFAHALGAALYEEYAYADDGSFISGTLRGLSAADHDGSAGAADPAFRIAVAVHAARRQGRRRGQLHEHAGVHRQCGRGCARRRRDRPAADAGEARGAHAHEARAVRLCARRVACRGARGARRRRQRRRA